MNQKIKVLWITNAFGCGGAEQQMLYMYDILKKYCEFDITILYYARVGDELNFKDVKTVYIDKDRVGKINTIREIRKLIKKENFQIVHAFGGSSANVYGRFGAIFTKAIPVGAMLGKRHFASKSMKIVNSFLNIFGNWWTVNNLDLIPILCRDLKFISKDKIRLLHNGFIPAENIDYHIESIIDIDYDKNDNFVFCAVGRIQPVKNYELYIRAAKKIIEKYDKVRFWLVGNGEEYDRLTLLVKELDISDKFKFWGYRKDIDDIMYRCDVFVQTSFTEGSPNTIAEAMRAGKPIISTRSTDLSEMIEEGKNGYVVPVDNEVELVNAMEKIMLRTQKERLNMGKYSKKMFETNFLDNRVAKEFDMFYKEILKRGKK